MKNTVLPKKELFSDFLTNLSDDEEILQNTPLRAEKAYSELLNGYAQIPEEVASKSFPSSMDEMIILKNITFESFCEHHIVPIIGTVSVGYIPNGRIIGASKLARLVDCFAHRLQLQEQLSIQIAETLDSLLNTLGTAVYVQGEHFCISKRGVKKNDARFITRYFTGQFKENYDLRREFLETIKG